MDFLGQFGEVGRQASQLFGYQPSPQEPEDSADENTTSKSSSVGVTTLNTGSDTPSVAIKAPKEVPPPDDSSSTSAMGFVVGLFVNTSEDKKVIRSVIQNSNSIFSLVKNNLKILQGVVAKFSPEAASALNEELIFHILANLILKMLPDGDIDNARKGISLKSGFQLTPEQLFENCFQKLVEAIGPGLNEADKEISEGRPVSKEVFLPLVENLMSFFLPKGDPLRSRILDFLLKPLIAGGIAKVYAPIADWFSGKKSTPSSEPSSLSLIQDELNIYAPMFVAKVAEHYLKKDKEFLHQLTGSDDFYDIFEKLAPVLYEQVKDKAVDDTLKQLGLGDNKGLIERGMQTAVMRGVCLLFANTFEHEISCGTCISTDEALHRLVTSFSYSSKGIFEKVGKEDPLTAFYRSSHSLVGMFLPKEVNLNWLQDLIKRREEALLKPIAEIKQSLYNGTVCDKSIDVYKDKFRKILWNRDAIRKSGTFGTDPIPKKPTEADSLRANFEPAIDQFYQLCGEAVATGKNLGIDLLSNQKFIFGLLQNFQTGLTDPVLRNLAIGAEKILTSESPEFGWIGDQIKHVLQGLLFKVLVNALKKVHAAERYPIEKLFYKAFESFLETGVREWPSIKEGIDQSKVSAVVNSWIDLISDGKFANLLPLPAAMQDKVETKIRDEAPQFFTEFLTAITSWIRDRKQTEASLNALFPKKEENEPCNLVKLLRLIPHATVLGVPYALRKNHTEITDKTIMPILAKALTYDPKNPQAPAEIIRRMIDGLLQELGDNDSKELAGFYQFIGEFSETTLLKFITFVTTQINRMEKGGMNTIAELNGVIEERKWETLDATEKAQLKECSILEYIIEKAIVMGSEHFRAISQTKEDCKKAKPSRDQFIKKFSELKILHPALQDENNRVPGVEIEDTHKKTHFKKLTGGILEKLKITKDTQFPVPRYARELFYKGLKKFIPLGLDTGYMALSNVESINQVLMTALNQAANEETVSIIDKLFLDSDYKKRIIDLKLKFDDNFQISLQKELGEIIVALVSLQPDWLPKQLVNNETLKNYAAEAIGQSIRGQLRSSITGQPISLLTMVDKAIEKVNDSVAPSVWNASDGRFEYKETTFAGKVVDSGNLNEAPNLARFFPKTVQEKEQKVKLEASLKKKAEKNVPRFLKKIISDQTDLIAVDAFIKMWEKIETSFHAWLISTFGPEHGKRASDVLLPALRWLIKKPLAIAVLIFNYTIWFIASQIPKLIINNQATKRLRDVKMHIHDNAIYHILELALNRIAEKISNMLQLTPASPDVKLDVKEEEAPIFIPRPEVEEQIVISN